MRRDLPLLTGHGFDNVHSYSSFIRILESELLSGINNIFLNIEVSSQVEKVQWTNFSCKLKNGVSKVVICKISRDEGTGSYLQKK